jgi:hypothetical protein
MRARTRGLGQLSLVKGDHYCAKVQDINHVLMKHIVKADKRYCSCQHAQDGVNTPERHVNMLKMVVLQCLQMKMVLLRHLQEYIKKKL